MGKAIPTQHPAVVLRAHYRQLRALLAIAMIAVVGLTAAVVILATDSDEVSSTNSAKPFESASSTRYDGGPEEGSRGVVPAQPPATRYDGGPEEGTRGALSPGAPSNAVPGTRYDGGPDEGSRGSGR